MARTLTRESLGRHFNEGARLLWLALRERDWNQSVAERQLGVSPGLVNRWLYGERRPGLEHALLIERALGIPASGWHREPALAFEPPAAAAAAGTEHKLNRRRARRAA
jgi:transcriptional regulator with XRE-family HTH domain